MTCCWHPAGWLLTDTTHVFLVIRWLTTFFMTRINGPKKKVTMMNNVELRRNFSWKCEETKERKLRMIFPVARHGRFFSSRFCFAFAICFHFRQFALSARKTYFSNYQHRLDEFLHKIFLDFSPPKQSICETNNRIFYFYFFWTYWFSEFLCFSRHILR
jgi:hypothetical protein